MRIFRDPYVWAGVASVVVSMAFAVLPILPEDLRFRWADEFSDVPLLLLTAAALFAACRASAQRRTAMFWCLLLMGTAAVLGTRVMYVLVDYDTWEIQRWPDLLQDTLYLCSYFFLAYVLERRPDRVPPAGPRGRLGQLEVLGTLVFVTALIGYFLVLPNLYSPETYFSWVPSLMLYSFLDAYIIVRLAHFVRGGVGPAFVWPFRMLLVVYALSLVADTLESLLFLGVIEWIDPGTLLDVVWQLPALAMLMMARSGGWPQPEGRPLTTAEAEPSPAVERLVPRYTGLAGIAMALPAIHLLLGVSGIREPSLDQPREGLLLGSIVVLAGLLIHHQSLVRRMTQDLDADRQLVSDQLQIAQRMEAVGRLAAGVAHDFANILSVIRGRAELLLMTGRVRENGREDTEEVLEAARRGQSLVRHLLTLSSRKPSEPQILDLDEVVQDFEPLLRRVLPETITVQVDPPGPYAVLAKCERSQIEQVLLNLTVNARDAMPLGGRLRVATQVEELDDRFVVVNGGGTGGEYSVLTVEDTGRGIAPELRNLVFEPFFSTKGEDSGSGLGLSIVYGVARQAGGFVRIFDGETGGTGLSVYFPRAHRPPAPMQAPSRSASAASGSGQETVLVVEDYDALRRTTARMLSEAGYRVIQAGTAAEALSVLERRNERVDVMLVDLLLPDIQGFELVRRVRDRVPDMVAVFMTGHPDAVPPEADAYTIVQKPFSPELLTLSIRRAVDEGKVVVN